ncbi:hypothetical protein GQ42DRAFT_151142 [Ramicandelaber brevisporus]|nr:hypothetical protein GQ42DRAFT_151142 [Ramicandelaber brevisporus]
MASKTSIEPAEALAAYKPGIKAWLVDKEQGWIRGTVSSVDVVPNKSVKIVFTPDPDSGFSASTAEFEATFDQLFVKKTHELPPLDNPQILEGIDDLTSLSHLHEPAVMHNIRVRYSQHNIYTYSGIVLIAVNPFQRVSLYSQEYIEAYAGKTREQCEPHLYSIAEGAFQGMTQEQRNQTIIVSGESGAGKTVSSAFIMRYLASVNDFNQSEMNAASARRPSTKSGSGRTQVEDQIMATNPILEAFGNAKTTRNDNSSRFGKYLEIKFNKNANIVGAFIRTYLLERSRLIFQPQTERNYHIFYQLCAAVPPTERREYSLGAFSDFHYLRQGGDGTIPGVDDAALFAETQSALQTIGVGNATQWKIFRLLAALLHIGNIGFGGTDRNGAFIPDSDEAFQTVVKLLEVEPAHFHKWIVKRQIVTRSEKIVSNLNNSQAAGVRDAIAKFIYSNLFDWLVVVINNTLLTPESASQVASFIGVLDIYGFEHFERNSFEQFCINYANEKLQQLFNQHVFKLEQEEYAREQISNWTFIEFNDNQPCIDMIEGRLGILALLDEESRFPSGTDVSFVGKLYKQHAVKEREAVFRKPRFSNTAFTIIHYAHDVTYESDGFLDKNKDTVSEEILDVLRKSTFDFLAEVIAVNDKSDTNANAAASPSGAKHLPQTRATPAPGGASKKQTLGSVFKASLVSLVETINATEKHYIRCIKPNEAKRAWEFDPKMVLSQLRACGVLETIRISCAGYPSRRPIEEFVERYYFLVNSQVRDTESDLRSFATRVLEAAINDPSKYQLGLTKVFFRAGMLAHLERVRSETLNRHVVNIQKHVRGHIAKIRYAKLKVAALLAQKLWRRALAMRLLDSIRRERAAIKLQSISRGILQRQSFLRDRARVITCQAVARAFIARRVVQAMREQRAALIIQCRWRGYSKYSAYEALKKAALVVQCHSRGRSAKLQLASLKVEARSITHIKEQSYRLEVKVVELTRQLQQRELGSKEFNQKLEAAESAARQWKTKAEALESKLTESSQQTATVSQDHIHEIGYLNAQIEHFISERKELKDKLERKEDQLEKLQEEMMNQRAQLIKANQQPVQNGKPVAESASTAATLAPAGQPSQQQQASVPAAATRSKSPIPPSVLTAENSSATKRQSLFESFRSRISGEGPNRSNQPSIGALLRHSIVGGPIPEEQQIELSTNVSSPTLAARPSSSGATAIPGALMSEAEYRALLMSDELIHELVGELVVSIQFPIPDVSRGDVPPQDILFVAHITGFIIFELLRFELHDQVRRVMMAMVSSIQHMSNTFEGDLITGFWMSNVFEMLSVVKALSIEHTTEEFSVQENGFQLGGLTFGMLPDSTWQSYSQRVISDVFGTLEQLLSDIYFNWAIDLHKRFVKLIVPGIIEGESLPGFAASQSTFFGRLMTAATGPAVKVEQVASFLNTLWRNLQFFFIDPSLMRQVATELMTMVGSIGFNSLMSRRNFCSWKRGMQIQYNLSRLDEWCKVHDVIELTHCYDRLTQAAKIMQLQKSTLEDLDHIFAFATELNPAQIKKLLTATAITEPEFQATPSVLAEVAKRAAASEKVDGVMVEVLNPNDMVLYLNARRIEYIDRYCPQGLHLPRTKALMASVGMQLDQYYRALEAAEQPPMQNIVPEAPPQLPHPSLTHPLAMENVNDA